MTAWPRSLIPTVCLSLPFPAPVHASVRLPGSKSITNRALLLAALAQGDSRLLAPLHSEDTFYMAQALRDLRGAGGRDRRPGIFYVTGTGGALQAPGQTAVSSAIPARRFGF